MPQDRRLAVAALLFAVANASAESPVSRLESAASSAAPADGNVASQPPRSEPSPDDSATHSALSW